MKNLTKKNILKLKQSSTLVINERCKKLINQGKKVYQFGFGQSPFPVPEKIVTALKNNAHRKEYLPIQGLGELRDSISKNLKKKIGINYPKKNIVITPGSKEAMHLLHVAFGFHMNLKQLLGETKFTGYKLQEKTTGFQLLNNLKKKLSQ